MDGPKELVRGLNAGADEFVSKPVNGHTLRARIRSMLRIKAQYDELERILRLHELLSNMIVHDMRNPLAVILIYIQLLKRKISSAADQDRYLELIHTEARQLNTFLDDILMLATTGKDDLALERIGVDMTKFGLELEHNYRAMADLKDVRFELIQATDSPPLIYLDIHLFQHALDNLIINALKTAAVSSKITLWIEYLRQSSKQNELPMLRINVIDEGVSIPPEDRERIFDKDEIVNLRQSDRSQAGLGLAFCRMVIEAHGGRIFVTDNVPQGSVFTVEI